MNTMTRCKNTPTLAAFFAAAVLAVAAGSANAAGKGPRASLTSTTQCALDLETAELVVTTTLDNASSGATVPETRDGGTIRAAYKHMDDKGNVIRYFPEEFQIPAGIAIPVQQSFEARFNLCDNGFPRQEVQDARALNGVADVKYGKSLGDEESRTVLNRCTDDPDTPENEGGIYVEDVIADITAACAAP